MPEPSPDPMDGWLIGQPRSGVPTPSPQNMEPHILFRIHTPRLLYYV